MAWARGAMADLGLDNNTMVHIYLSLNGYAQGAALHVANEIEAERRTGMTPDEWWETQEPLAERISTSGRFPLDLKHVIDDVDVRPETWFEFGLQRLLDGVELLIAERASE